MATTSAVVTSERRTFLYDFDNGTVKFVANYTIRPHDGDIEQMHYRYKVAEAVIYQWYAVAVSYFEGIVPNLDECRDYPVYQTIDGFEPIDDGLDPIITIFGNVVNGNTGISLSFTEKATEREIWQALVSHHNLSNDIASEIGCLAYGARQYQTEITSGAKKTKKKPDPVTPFSVKNATELNELPDSTVFRIPVCAIKVATNKNGTQNVVFSTWTYNNDGIWTQSDETMKANEKGFSETLENFLKKASVTGDTEETTYSVPGGERPLTITAKKRIGKWGAYYTDIDVEMGK